MIQTDICYEYTDTFGGEPNYSWVKRGTISMPEGEEYSDKKAVHLVKAELGMSGVQCRRNDSGGDQIELRPYRSCTVLFIWFHSHGRCEPGYGRKCFRTYTGVQKFVRTFKGWENATASTDFKVLLIVGGPKVLRIPVPNRHIRELTYNMVADAIEAATCKLTG